MGEDDKIIDDASIYYEGMPTEDNWKSFIEYAVGRVDGILNDSYRFIEQLAIVKHKMANATSREECIAIAEDINSVADSFEVLRSVFGG